MNFLNKKRKLYILIFLMFIVSLNGCSMFGGKAQKKPQISKQEIQSNVKKEMKTPETQKIIQDAAKTQKLVDLLNTPEADHLIQKKIIDNLDTSKVSVKLQENLTKALASPDIQKQFQEHVKKSMATPEVEKAVSSAVQAAVMKIIQGGGQGGKGGGGQAGGGGGKSGGGGGQSGGPGGS